jgi:hypothetical protein
MNVKLVEIEPGRWRFVKPATPPARSALPRPYVISDTMEPTEQVDGRFYTSKSQFRATGRALGLIEVGNDKLPLKVRATDLPETKRARRSSLKKALEKYRAGHRVRAP